MNVASRNAMRPAERTPHAVLAGVLNWFRKFVGDDRHENLFGVLRTEIVGLRKEKLSLLDYGCGSMQFSLRLAQQQDVGRIFAMDTYPKPVHDPVGEPHWANYQQVEPGTVGEISERVDLAMTIDVLHHAPEGQHQSILTSLSHVADRILVKDHFEHGFVSRQLLRLADWYGNFAFGVEIPRRYFNPERWQSLVERSGLVELKRIENVKVHNGVFGLINPPRHHFVSILRKK